MVLSLVSCLPVLFTLAQTVSSLPQDQGNGISSSTPTTPCNNSPLLCARPYNNITHMGAHNAAFLRDSSTSFSLAGNQFHNATVSLSAGIRLLQAQVHLQDDQLTLCHTSCTLLSAGPLQTWLASIKTWLDGHPNDVVTLLLVNAANANGSLFGSAFEASGIAGYGFVPPPAPEATNGTELPAWPTLQEMIDSNQRLVTFVTGLPALNASDPDSDPYPPYLLSEFAHLFETPYEITDPSHFVCTVDRPTNSGLAFPNASVALDAGLLPLVNHFAYTAVTDSITIPNIGSINATNSAEADGRGKGSLGWHLLACKTEWRGRKPVFVLVDFWDRGDVLEVADQLNGVEGSTVGREKVVEDGVEAVESAGGKAGAATGLGRMLALVGIVVGALVAV